MSVAVRETSRARYSSEAALLSCIVLASVVYSVPHESSFVELAVQICTRSPATTHSWSRQGRWTMKYSLYVLRTAYVCDYAGIHPTRCLDCRSRMARHRILRRTSPPVHTHTIFLPFGAVNWSRIRKSKHWCIFRGHTWGWFGSLPSRPVPSTSSVFTQIV